MWFISFENIRLFFRFDYFLHIFKNLVFFLEIPLIFFPMSRCFYQCFFSVIFSLCSAVVTPIFFLVFKFGKWDLGIDKGECRKSVDKYSFFDVGGRS